MPMPTKYLLKMSRPRRKFELTGHLAISGNIVVNEGKGEVYLKAVRLTKNQRIGYWSPSGMYSVACGRVPESVVAKSIIMQRADTGECIYTRIKTECHFSIFMELTSDIAKANCMINSDSSIVIVNDEVDAFFKPQRLICYWGIWRLIFTDTTYPQYITSLQVKPPRIQLLAHKHSEQEQEQEEEEECLTPMQQEQCRPRYPIAKQLHKVRVLRAIVIRDMHEPVTARKTSQTHKEQGSERRPMHLHIQEQVDVEELSPPRSLDTLLSEVGQNIDRIFSNASYDITRYSEFVSTLL